MPLADSIPTDIIRESGFADWVVYALVALFIIREFRGWIIPEKRHITGSIESSEVKEFADKKEVESKLAKMAAAVESVEEQNIAETQRLSTDGQNRVHVLSELIRTELNARDSKLDEMKTAVLTKIEGLMVYTTRHDALIPEINNRLNTFIQNHAESMRHVHERINDAMKKRP